MAGTTQKVCSNGHSFNKRSDCPVCPVCEGLKKPTTGFMSQIPAPARRALLNNGICSLSDLERYSESELLALHGFGPGSLPKLRIALEAAGKRFRDQDTTRISTG